MKGNKRFESTDLKIQEAFFRLLDFQHIDDIDIKSICKEANISRSTFYQHYQSIASLIETIEARIDTEKNTNPVINNPNTLYEEKNCVVLEIIKKYRAFFLAFLTHNSPSIKMANWIEKVTTEYINIIQQHLQSDFCLSTQDLYNFSTAGAKAMLVNWLSSGCEEEITLLSKKLFEVSTKTRSQRENNLVK